METLDIGQVFQALGGLGIGGVIAGIVMLWKRQDDRSRADELRAQREEAKADRELMRQTLEANTSALMELNKTQTSIIETLQGQERTDQALARIESQLSAFQTKPIKGVD